MDESRIDYIERLIIGVREMVEEETAKDPICQQFPNTIPSRFFDALNLCDVIEVEALPILKRVK